MGRTSLNNQLQLFFETTSIIDPVAGGIVRQGEVRSRMLADIWLGASFGRTYRESAAGSGPIRLIGECRLGRPRRSSLNCRGRIVDPGLFPGCYKKDEDRLAAPNAEKKVIVVDVGDRWITVRQSAADAPIRIAYLGL